MGDVVNLRQARKLKARQVRERAAEDNRARFGQTKAERKLRQMQDEAARTSLDGHKREPRGRSGD